MAFPPTVKVAHGVDPAAVVGVVVISGLVVVSQTVPSKKDN